MLLILLLLTPLIGIFLVSTIVTSEKMNIGSGHRIIESSLYKLKQIKIIALSTSIINLFISLVVFMLFNFSNNNFQFVQEYHRISSFDFYLGVDGLSIYFVLLTTIIMPIALLSN
jgi:NADH:ubiquinone oxidoreductase subunit 4 (subunit M)